MHTITLAVLVALATSGAHSSHPAAKRGGFSASNPTAAVTRLVEAYNARSAPRVDALLTSDYRFHFSVSDSAGANWTQGLPRDFEMVSTARLFSRTVPVGGIRHPPLDSLSLSVGAIDVGVDPEHADSSAQYRIAIAHDYALRLVFADSMVVTTPPALHIFHVVRGDAAVLMPGQVASRTRWYIRRWIEDANSVTIALGKVDGECSGGAEESSSLSSIPGLVGLRAIGAPLCPTLKVLCDLPGSEPADLEVFDLQGRRVAQRAVTPQSPGSVLVEAGSGTRFTPGAYWVRLTQGVRAPVTRLVMVAR